MLDTSPYHREAGEWGKNARAAMYCAVYTRFA